ncbi:thioredoxin family protein [Phaeobacter marinintestinus]|uniref:thioredoxin family protein n=1 Tax=Falsiphaeobacter marinintestinus TaxID=1492905 RepID=UPI0011B71A77|nr:thioredoxin family protein [Phaeobacter marinintestinus]
MSLVSPPVCDFGWAAPDFSLPATDGKTYALSDIAGPKGTLIMFICNHCPYVLGVLDRLIIDVAELQIAGIGVAAISSNDVASYPADSFDKMAVLAETRGLPFPYLYDESQEVAKAYGASCTPDFFGFNADLGLQYRGRLDAAGKNPRPADMQRDLVTAMLQVAETGNGPTDQIPSMGCSIKWKAS